MEVAAEWRKSSYSGGDGGNCGEDAACPGVVHVRDSKDKDLGALAVSSGAWVSYVGFAAGRRTAASG